MRESFKDGIFGTNAHRHLATLSKLEGYLLKDRELNVLHILAGMNNFA